MCVCVFTNATDNQVGVQHNKSTIFTTTPDGFDRLITNPSRRDYKKEEKQKQASDSERFRSHLLVFPVSAHFSEHSAFCCLKSLIDAASRMTNAGAGMPNAFWSASSPSAFQPRRHPSATAASFCVCVRARACDAGEGENASELILFTVCRSEMCANLHTQRLKGVRNTLSLARSCTERCARSFWNHTCNQTTADLVKARSGRVQQTGRQHF